MHFIYVTLPAALFPGLVLLVWFRNSDKFPEPWPVVFRTFALGVFSVIPIMVAGSFLKPWLGAVPDTALAHAGYTAFVLAALPEECFKFLVLVLYSARHMEFDEPMDGIVYGVAVSLGFASLENILYVSKGGLSVALLRAVTSVPGHAMMGAVMGYFVGLCLVKPGRRFALLTAALVFPMIIHGMYDFPLMWMAEMNHRGQGAQANALAGMMFLAVVVFMWSLAMVYKKRLRRLQGLTQKA